MIPVSQGKPCAGNPHARFEEGASAPETPRRNALLHRNLWGHPAEPLVSQWKVVQMAMPQRDDTIEAIKRLDALLEYAVMIEGQTPLVE